MGKKISNPPPPDNVARPAPPPNPPRPPSWQGDIDKVRRLRDALDQVQKLQRVTAGTVSQQDDLLNMYSERIEQLEADLSLCALRLENCIVASGTDREFAKQAVAKYRQLIAGGSDPCKDGHDFVSLGDGTARCSNCPEQVDVSETGAARRGSDGDTVTVAAVDVATDRIEHEIEGWNGDQTVPDPEPE